MILMTILGPSGLLLAVGSVAAYAVLGRKRSKSGGTAKPSATSTTRPLPPPPPPSPSPLVAGSNCTEVADEAEIMRWLGEVVEPVLRPRIDAYDVPLDDHEQARRTVAEIVDEVFATTVPQCKGYATRATRLVWKALWCEVVMQLVLRGKLDEELDDVMSLCLDPSFDPRATPHIEHDEPILEPPVMPPPWLPSEPVPPMDAREGEPPPNVWVASSRQELSQLGVMRMMEGTAAGMPIMGPAAHLVMLGFNPAWAGVEQARADMAALAAENPGLTFVEVSFADTQRHFGKPRDVNGIAWALTAAAPDGRVFSEPIALHDHDDPPPSAEQWTKVIAHASGFVGQRSVQRIARPRRFGDLTRSLVRAHRPRKRATPAIRPRKPSTQRPPRRRG